MNYYLVEVAVTAEGTAKAITEKETLHDAIMQYHQTMASMYANSNVIVGFCTILDKQGRQNFDYTSYYTRPVEQSEADA